MRLTHPRACWGRVYAAREVARGVGTPQRGGRLRVLSACWGCPNECRASCACCLMIRAAPRGPHIARMRRIIDFHRRARSQSALRPRSLNSHASRRPGSPSVRHRNTNVPKSQSWSMAVNSSNAPKSPFAMGDFVTVSDRLSALLWRAMNFASEQIKKGYFPFRPFVISQDHDKSELTVLEEQDGAHIQRRGLRVIGERCPARAVLCYDGFLTIGEKRKDAIYAIACEAGLRDANVFARPYKPKAFLRPFVSFEKLARYGVVENPLADREPERKQGDLS